MSDFKNISDKSKLLNSLDPKSPKIRNDKRDPKMLEAARSFENQFLRQMVSQMRKTVPKDELIPESMADNIFREQLDNEYTDQWVNSGGVGLADVIYDQLNEKYGNVAKLPPKSNGEFLEVKPSHQSSSRSPGQPPHDLLSKADGNLFLAKKEAQGFLLKSHEPLKNPVGLHVPLSGLVLQAASLEDGRQMVVVKHDEGLVSQIVHTGRNQVKTGERIEAGTIVADLLPSTDGAPAKVFFGLRKASKTE